MQRDAQRQSIGGDIEESGATGAKAAIVASMTGLMAVPIGAGNRQNLCVMTRIRSHRGMMMFVMILHRLAGPMTG